MNQNNNFRAHKKALKKAKKRNSHKSYKKQIKKMEREKNEKFSTQFDLLLDDIDNKIKKMNAKINVARDKISYRFNQLLPKKKNDEEKFLYDLINEFALQRKISFFLAATILLNVIFVNYQNSVDEEMERIRRAKQNPRPSISVQKYKEQIVDETVAIQIEKRQLLENAHEIISNIKIKPTEPTDEEKLAIVLDKYGITEYQFLYIVAVALLEAGKAPVEAELNYYDSCYDVISSGFNRINSASCINFVNSRMGQNAGFNIYNQFVCPGQYTVSKDEIRELLKEDLSVYGGYYAVLDMLYTSVPSHNYYRFVSEEVNRRKGYGGIKLRPYCDNCYHSEVLEYDRVSPGDFLPNYNKHLNDYLDYLEALQEYEEYSKSIQEEKILLLEPMQNSTIR